MRTALDTLLEGFSERVHPRGWHGRFTVGDHVRVEGAGVKGERSITGRVVRPSDAYPESHVVIAPHGGGPHVLAKVEHVKLDTPARASGEKQKRELAHDPRGPVRPQDVVASRHPAKPQGLPADATRLQRARERAARPRSGETTAQQIERKSPGAARKAERYRSTYRGAKRGRVKEAETAVLGSLLEGAELSERFVSSAARAKAASKGHALHVDGRDIFPIESAKDAQNAVTLWLSGHHKTAQAKAHIIRNARKVGALDQVKRIQGQGGS